MIAYYPMFKHLHMTLALVSLLLFIYRWSLALAGSDRLQQKWLKILPHINDTFLLLFGVLLAVALQLTGGRCGGTGGVWLHGRCGHHQVSLVVADVSKRGESCSPLKSYSVMN